MRSLSPLPDSPHFPQGKNEYPLVIGVLPNEDSVLCLMGSVLIERHDAMLSGKSVFSKESLSSLMKSDVPVKLIVIVEEQRRLLAV